MNTQAQLPRDPILQKYADLIQSIAPSRFKQIYYGDPVRIPTSMLPALILERRQTTVSPFTNAEDKHNMQISFTVVSDIRNDISDDSTLTPGNTTLYDIMEGRDASTLQLKQDSLLYMLRHNIDVAPVAQLWTDAEGNQSMVEYSMTINKRQPTSFSLEAVLTVVCTQVVLR